MGDSESGDHCSSYTDTISNINDVLSKKEKSLEDDRLDCSNSYYLDKINEVAVRHVTELAESHLNDCKEHFIHRFSEIFKNFIQENVTVRGLPWMINDDKLTTGEKQEQKLETTDALLSRLSKTLEKTAEKRKITPQNCSRLYSMLSKHERQNLKRARLEASITLPSVSSLPRPISQDQSEELVAVYKNIELAQQEIEKQKEKLSLIQRQIKVAEKIAKHNDGHSETLYDTGYISE